MTYFLENLTVQLASQIGPRPTNVYSKDGITWNLVGNTFISWVMSRLAVVVDCSMWPLDVPTHTLGEVGLEFWNGDLGEM